MTLVIRISSNECGVLGARGFDTHAGVLVNQFSFFFFKLKSVLSIYNNSRLYN